MTQPDRDRQKKRTEKARAGGSVLNELGNMVDQGGALSGQPLRFIGEQMDEAGKALREDYASNPAREGWATRFVGGVADMLVHEMTSNTIAPGSGLVSLGVTGKVEGAEELRAHGVDGETADIGGAIKGMADAYGMKLSLGKPGFSFLKNLGYGTLKQTAFAEATNDTIYGLLKAKGYDQQAEQYKIFDASRLLSEAAGGAIFSSVHHGVMALNADAHGATKDALLTANLANHLETGLGIPADAITASAHNERVKLALEMAGKGEIENLPPLGPQETYIPHESPHDVPALVREVFKDIGVEPEDIAHGGEEQWSPEQDAHLLGDDVQYSRKAEPGNDIGEQLMWRVENDYPALSKEYDGINDEKLGLTTEGGRIVNTDLSRELSPAYANDRYLASKVYKAAKAFAEKKFNELLARPTAKGKDSRVIFTAGGTGVGKSEGVAKLGQVATGADFILDSTLSDYGAAKDKIDRVLKSQRKALIIYTYRDSIDALVNGALSRAEAMKRPVPIEAHALSQVGARDVIPKLMDAYKNDPRVEFVIVDNSRGKGASVVSSIDKIPPVPYHGLEELLHEHAKREYNAGNISEQTYRGTIARRSAGGDAQGMGREGGAGSSSESKFASSTKVGSGEAEGSGHTVESATAELTSTPEGTAVHGSGLVQVVSDVPELPARPDGAPHGDNVQAVFQGDKVYLVAKNLAHGEVWSKLLHEVGAHYGMERMLGRDLHAQLLSEVRQKAEAGEGLFKKARDYARKVGTPEHQLDSETLAYLVDHHPELGVVQRIFSAIKTFLYKALNGRIIDLSSADIKYLAEASLRRVAREQIKNPLGSVSAAHADADKAAESEINSLYARKDATESLIDQLLKKAGMQNVPQLVKDALPDGHSFSKADAEEARQQIRKVLKYIPPSVTDPQDRLKQAAKFIADNLQERAVKAKGDRVLNADVNQKLRSNLGGMVQKGIALFGEQGAKGLTSMGAFTRMLFRNFDGKTVGPNLEAIKEGVVNGAKRKLAEVYHDSGKFLGLFENVAFTHDLIREIYNLAHEKPTSTGNAKAIEGAKAWVEATQPLLEQARRLGRTVHSLKDWAIPISHDALKIAKAGGFMLNDARDYWVERVLPLLNRGRYKNVDGTPMTDDGVRDLLRNAWRTISSEGRLNDDPNDKGPMNMAKLGERRKNQHREIFFKDGDAHLEYHNEFGEMSAWDTMSSHIEYMGKQIAQLQMFGPSGKTNFNQMVEAAAKAAVDPDMGGDPARQEHISNEVENLKNAYDYLSGDLVSMASRNRWSKLHRTLSNLMVSAMGGGFTVHAFFNDQPLLMAAAAMYNIPQMELTRAQLRLATSSVARENVRRMGCALQDMNSETARFFSGVIGPAFSAKMANANLKVTLLHYVDTIRRGAIGMGLYSHLGDLVNSHNALADLDPTTSRMLLGHGINEENFQVMKASKRTAWGDGVLWKGMQVLDPDSILAVKDHEIQPLIDARAGKLDALLQQKVEQISKSALLTPEQKRVNIDQWTKALSKQKEGLGQTIREEAMQKLISVSNTEEASVVPTPGARQRDYIDRTFNNSTLLGTLLRSTTMFKGFAVSQFGNSMQRMAGMPAGWKGVYAASMIASLTVAGAMNQMFSDFTKGKNPRNYLNPQADHFAKDWIEALVRGGALGLFGDVLLKDEAGASVGTKILKGLAGPMVGLLGDVADLTIGSAHNAALGEETHVGARALKVARQTIIPGQNIWYARLLLDHFIFHDLQEQLSPGYLQRMQHRAEADYGQTYWAGPRGYWGGGEVNAPNLKTMAGPE